ncbi:hypothetical protein [Adhaeretor mobilis]|uniref:Uncharacterized protein n=1 Tax=Adhaeretor mobilis TaxID=1930276 RepID=A0A517MXN2_9BACT|nr:hypothetical protein [Adhaeretor mobilis]QDS99623.1 hypothetical protein HG15A2_29490 [Adhaeretor mobilis]
MRFTTCLALIAIFGSSSRTSALDILFDQAQFAPVVLAAPAQESSHSEAAYVATITSLPLVGLSDFATQSALVNRAKENDWKGFPLAVVDPAILQMEQQFLNQYKPQLNAKLHHLRSVCRPSLEQQKAILEDCKQAMTQSVRAFAVQQFKQNQGGGGMGLAVPAVHVRNGRQVSSNPQTAIEQALKQAAHDHLNEQQQKLYSADKRERAAFKKQVGVRNLTAMLDRRLILTTEQRIDLMTMLEKSWKVNWMNSVENLVHGNETIPQLPDKLMKPLLNKRQQEIWKDMQKNNRQHFFGGMHFMHNGAQVEPFVPEELSEPQAANPPKQPVKQGSPS